MVSVEGKPLISIITPCLNRYGYISEAIQSVCSQNYPNIEHIIVDGGSTDGTLEILYSYPHLKIISEPDRGLYDAINKGLRVSQGDIIGFLNTDDLYEPNVFFDIAEAFMSKAELEAIVGGASIFIENPTGHSERIMTFESIQPVDFLYRITVGMPIFNAWFFRKNVFDRFGCFDVKYKYVADRDFLIRLALGDLWFYSIKKILYHYRQHENSLTFRHENNAESHFVFESLVLAENYLNRSAIPGSVKKYLRLWYDQIITDQVFLALSQFRLLSAVKYAQNGWRSNHRWPWLFTESVIMSAMRIVNRLFY